MRPAHGLAVLLALSVMTDAVNARAGGAVAGHGRLIEAGPGKTYVRRQYENRILESRLREAFERVEEPLRRPVPRVLASEATTQAPVWVAPNLAASVEWARTFPEASPGKLGRSLGSDLGGTTSLQSASVPGLRPPLEWDLTGSAFLRREYLLSSVLLQYRLTDPSGQQIFAGDDPGQLAGILNDQLLKFPDQPLDVKMEGFPLHKKAAFVTTHRIRQELIDRSVSIEDLSSDGIRLKKMSVAMNADIGGLPYRAASDGIRLKKMSVAMNADIGGLPYRAELAFTSRFSSGIKSISLRVSSATVNVILDFIGRVYEILYWQDFYEALRKYRSPGEYRIQPVLEIKQTELTAEEQRQQSVREHLSLRALVDQVRRELKVKHKELTEQQLNIEMIDQFGNISVVELTLGKGVAWS
jgi:hypothetical protein